MVKEQNHDSELTANMWQISHIQQQSDGVTLLETYIVIVLHGKTRLYQHLVGGSAGRGSAGRVFLLLRGYDRPLGAPEDVGMSRSLWQKEEEGSGTV